MCLSCSSSRHRRTEGNWGSKDNNRRNTSKIKTQMKVSTKERRKEQGDEQCGSKFEKT